MSKLGRISCVVILVLGLAACRRDGVRPLVVGSKNFSESLLLGEILAQLLEDRGFPVVRNFSLGGTLICFEALRHGDLDVYVEYSGTLAQAIFKLPGRVSFEELQRTVRERFGGDLLSPMGFNNTYALVLSRSVAARLGAKTIGDLGRHAGLGYGFSPDFHQRADGWPGVAAAYGLDAKPLVMEHVLGYQAVRDGKLDVTDAYSTEGEVAAFDLVLLEDDRKFFADYLGAPLVRAGTEPRVKSALNELAGKIGDDEMRTMNTRVLRKERNIAGVADDFLRSKKLLRAGGSAARTPEGKWAALLARTGQHLKLTFMALLAAVLVAVPLGVLVYRLRGVARPVVYLAGILQTIPSIALLAFMIPLFGTRERPAVAALFLYALLPILRNTMMALFSIDPSLKKVSVGMGLTAWQRLVHIELPLGAPMILAGIKTAAVVNIGLGTLAAFIGAGGLGEPIVTGLYTYDTRLILEGAIPAAVLSILIELGFELVERRLVPSHLKQRAAR